MENEVLVAGIDPRITSFEFVDGTWEGVCNGYDFEVYQLSRPITRKPKYFAVSSIFGSLIKKNGKD